MLVDHVADLARAAGADVEMYDVEPGRPNLLAWIRRGNRPTLMFECHLDTVGLAPMPDALNPRGIFAVPMDGPVKSHTRWRVRRIINLRSGPQITMLNTPPCQSCRRWLLPN